MTSTLVPDVRPRILLVDDDPLLRHLVRHRLDGLQVRTASDLARARALLREQRFDCVVLDLGLPDGDGRELLAMADLDRLPPVVVITGRERVLLPTHEGRAVEVLRKPDLDLDKLRQAVEHAIGEGGIPDVTRSDPPGRSPRADDVKVVVSTIRSLLGHGRVGVEVRVVPHGAREVHLPLRLATAACEGTVAQLDAALLDVRLQVLRGIRPSGIVCLPVLLQSILDPRFRERLLCGVRAFDRAEPVLSCWGDLAGARVSDLHAAADDLRTAGVRLGMSQVGRGRTPVEALIALRPSLLRLDARLTRDLVRHADDVRGIAEVGRLWGARVLAPQLRRADVRLAAALGVTHMLRRRVAPVRRLG